ncbi:Plasma membrane proteolipid 3 [Saitozyma sp. JCM 24511]|nr:Plasma membrane proteolipid 3 [Saitozyma sp. JCM 24511]
MPSGNSAMSTMSDIVLYIIAIFLPPLAVFARTGCGADVLINILLWFFGWIPGTIHAFYIIWKTSPERNPTPAYSSRY